MNKRLYMYFVTVKNLLLLFSIYTFSCATQDFNTTMNTETDLHQGTPNILVSLGNTLKEQLLKPVSDAKIGQQVVEDLLQYYRHLRDVLDMLKSKDAIEKKLGMKLFSGLLVSGGPPHLDEDFDMEYAMEKYQWNNKVVFSVRKVLDETDILWQDLQQEVEKPSVNVAETE